jgi:membrane associated rhomboid family serine protease
MPDSWDFSEKRKRLISMPQLPIMTCMLCGLCILLTLANQTSASAPPGSFWSKMGHFGIWKEEDIWSGHFAALFTSVFIHGAPGHLGLTLVHIGFNLVWFYKLGSVLEETLNPLLLALFFITAAIVGSGAQLAVSSETGVGASGVVYAMFGLMWAGRRHFPAWREIATKENYNFFIIWGVFCIVATWLKALNVANAAHFGGLLYGLAIGWVFVEKENRVRGIAALIGLAALVTISVTYLPWSSRWTFWKAMQEASRGEFDTAVSLFQKSLKLGYKPPSAVWYNIAAVEQRRHNPDAEMKALKKAEESGLTLGDDLGAPPPDNRAPPSTGEPSSGGEVSSGGT